MQGLSVDSYDDCKDKMIYRRKIKTLLLPFFLAILPAIWTIEGADPQAVIAQMNGQLKEKGQMGKFVVKQGHVLFQGMVTPDWAIKKALESIGVKTVHGTGGIDPYKAYSHDEWKKTPLYLYLMGPRHCRDTWSDKKDKNGRHSGLSLLAEVVRKHGPEIFTDLHEDELRRAWWCRQLQETIPMLLATLKDKKVALISMVGVLLFIGVPLFIWNGSKTIFQWLFLRRPEIIGPDDTDIYKSQLARLFHRGKKLPEVIVNGALDRRLKRLVAENEKTTQENIKAWQSSSIFS